jgi:Protein of unknown function (DUF3592)
VFDVPSVDASTSTVDQCFFGLFLAIVLFIDLTICFEIVTLYILEYGDLVMGRIIDVSLNEFNLVLTYTYEYGGKTYSATQKVSKKAYRKIPDGTWIRVRCLPKHPQQSRIDERWSLWSGWL